MSASVTVFAPASVSNVGCGFDVLGFALTHPGDEVEARESDRPGVTVGAIEGDGGRLPREADANTASVAARALLEALGVRRGVELIVRKKMPLASGLGSSAASAVGAVVAVNELLGLGASRDLLLRSAVQGERRASGSSHADNCAPSLHGGFVLVRGGGDDPEVVHLPTPPGLACAMLHPRVEIHTGHSRALLGDVVPLREAVIQWGNVGSLVAGLYACDYALIGRSIVDVIAEPKRAPLVPAFAEIKRAALDAGAIGCSLSGSGPSIFALCRTLEEADEVAAAMAAALAAHTHVPGAAWSSIVNPVGAHVIRSEAPCGS